MPVGKRRKSSQSECSDRETLGVRMTSDLSDTGEVEKKDVLKDSEDMCGVEGKHRNDLTTTASTSGPSQSGYKDVEVPGTSSASQPQPQFAQPNIAKNMSTRSSTRVIKRPKRDAHSPPPSPVKKQVAKEAKTSTPETKTKRQWELWGNVDKKAFFDGLCEFGKDFDAIQSHIAFKCRKKGFVPALIRNKNQIRHFYYRTWHKISKYIRFPPEVKKQTQELYGLINYGELRKRIGGSLAERHVQKLNELVHKGNILVRIKGKNHRVRTPVCFALKKLNNIEEPRTDNRPEVPTKVTLEIGARTNAAWAGVQELSQNPRVRITMKANQRLSAVIAFLEKKWKPERLRIKESLDTTEVTNKQLRLFPHKESQIHPVSLKLAEVQPRLELQFDNYKKLVLDEKTFGQVSEIPDGTGNKSESSQSGTDGVTSPDGSRVTCSSMLSSTGLLMDDENARFPDDLLLPGSVICKSNFDEDCKPDIVGESLTNGSESLESVICVNTGTSATDLPHSDGNAVTPSKPERKPVDIQETIKKGWSLLESENITLAELYLMFGENGKLRVEYDWCDIKTTGLLALQQLTNLLRRLVHLSNTEFSDLSKPKQTATMSSEGQPLCQKCLAPISLSSAAGKSQSQKACTKNTNSKVTGSPTSSTANNSNINTRSTSPESRDPLRRVRASVLTQGINAQMKAPPARVEPTKTEMLLGGQYKKSRPVRKPMIVQRRLLPKAQSLLSKAQSHQLMTLSMIPSSNMSVTANFLPLKPSAQSVTMNNPNVIPRIISSPLVNSVAPLDTRLQEEPIRPVVSKSLISLSSPTPVSADPSTTDIGGSDSFIECQLVADLAAVLPPSNTPLQLLQESVHPPLSSSSPPSLTSPHHDSLVTPSCSPTSSVHSEAVNQAAISPPSLSSFLEMSLLQTQQGTGTSDRLLDMQTVNSGFSVLSGSTSKEKTTSTSSSVLHLPSISGADNSLSSSSFSASQWLAAADITDISGLSLSGFLDLTEKRSGDIPTTSAMSILPLNIFSDASRDLTKMDVDSTLQCMLNESSMDYAAKFADIAAQMVASTELRTEPPTTHLNTADTVQ